MLRGCGHVRSGCLSRCFDALELQQFTSAKRSSAITPNHHFGFSQTSYECYQISFQLVFTAEIKEEPRVTHGKTTNDQKVFAFGVDFFSPLLQDRGCWSTTAPRGTRTVLRVTPVRSPSVQRPSSQTKTTTTACPATRAGLLLSAATAKRCKNNLIVKTFLWKIPEYTKIYHYRAQN